MDIEIKFFNDIWLDNGLANYARILQDIEEDNEDSNLLRININERELRYQFEDEKLFLQELASTIISKRGNLIVEAEDKKTKVKKEVKKEHILVQENQKVGGKVAFKESIFQNEKTEEILTQSFDSLKGNKKFCFFCNREFKTSIKKVQQASYPFVTKIKSLSGIRTGTENKLIEYISDYCPQCYLIGILEWLDDSIIYRNLPGGKSIIILPFAEDLKKMIEIKKVLNSYILENTKRWSNILIDYGENKNGETESTPDKYSTFISFYENFIRHVKDFPAYKWIVIEIPPSTVKNPKYFNIDITPNIFNIINILSKNGEHYFYRIFIKEFYSFYIDPKKGIRNFDHEKISRETLCEAFIKDDFAKFARAFIPRKGNKPGISKDAYKILEILINYWRIERMQIEEKEKYLKNLRTASSMISKLIDDNIGLFFKLEKSKTTIQLLEALQEISRRAFINKKIKIEGYEKYAFEEITKQLVENEDKEFFQTTKNIILIYTSLRIKNTKDEEQKNDND